MGGHHHNFRRLPAQHPGGGAVHGGMRLEHAGVFHRYNGVKGDTDVIPAQLFQIGLLAVGQGDQPIASAVGQALQAGHGVRVRRQVVVHRHKISDGGVVHRYAVAAQAVDEGAAAGFPVAAMPQHKEVVLVLLNALPVAPVPPEIGAADRRRPLRGQKPAGRRGQTAAQIQDGAENVKSQGVDRGQGGGSHQQSAPGGWGWGDYVRHSNPLPVIPVQAGIYGCRFSYRCGG